MNTEGGLNIFETLKDDIQLWGTVLDLGCGEFSHRVRINDTLNDLFSFDPSNFKRIYGVDLNPPDTVNCHILYRHYMLMKLGLPPSEHSRNGEFIKRFDERYVVESGDIRTWTCRNESISLVVCDFVLHFIPHSDQPTIICKMMGFLESGGLLWIRSNSTTHPEIITPKNTFHLGDHTYKEKHGGQPRTFYLTLPEILLAQIPGVTVLAKYSDINDKNFTLVFRK